MKIKIISQQTKLKILRLFENILGIQIFYKTKSIDEIYIKNLNSTPFIFDVGANEGQSIERFKKIFPESKIFSFEPLHFLEEKLSNKQKKYKNVDYFLFGFGDKNTKKDIYVNSNTGTSSFFKLIPNSSWLNKKAKELDVKESEFRKNKTSVVLKRLDDFIDENNIQNIDILKIDVQGFESFIFQGAKNSLAKKLFNYIEVELILSGIYELENSFYNVEKYLIPLGYKLVSLKRANSDNIFEGHKFEFDLLYSRSH